VPFLQASSPATGHRLALVPPDGCLVCELFTGPSGLLKAQE
jgi:hypothetical protein